MESDRAIDRRAVLLGGPNGAGKSTFAPSLVDERLGIPHRSNADLIAIGLSARRPDRAFVHAGRAMLAWTERLVHTGQAFVVETTLAGYAWAARCRRWRRAGYDVGVVFLWVSEADVAVRRVQERARRGGITIDEATIRRRHSRSARNLILAYEPVVDWWSAFDDSGDTPIPLADYDRTRGRIIRDPVGWRAVVAAGASPPAR